MTYRARLPDWQVRMDKCVRAMSTRPYEWGVFDCCVMAADIVQAVTGHDPMQDLRGAYQTERQAMSVLAGLGGLEAALTERLGMPISPLMAQPGDIGLGGTTGTASIFYGGGAWHACTDMGLMAVNAPAKAWRSANV